MTTARRRSGSSSLAPTPIDYFGTGNDAGDHSFLSNFFDVPDGVIFAGLVYPTVEHAYQAAKTIDPDWRLRIHDADSPKIAKRLGREAPLRPGWERGKIDVMEVLLERKFAGPYLARLLIATGDAELIEGNFWHDNVWGDCRCGKRRECEQLGRNLLGELLMGVRHRIRGEYSIDPLESLVIRQ